MLKYIYCIIIGILIYLLWNGVEKFNVGALKAIFEYNPTTTSWERTLYATQTDITDGLVAGLAAGFEDTDYELVDDYTPVPAPEPLEGNFQFQVGDNDSESGTNLHDIYIQLNRLLQAHNINPDNRRINPPDDDANIGKCFVSEGVPPYTLPESIPPECLTYLGYYPELQDDTSELLFNKYQSLQQLFGDNSCSAVIISTLGAQQRLAFSKLGIAISDDLMEMISQQIDDESILETHYRIWQNDFNTYMMNKFNREIQEAFDLASGGQNDELLVITNQFKLNVDLDELGKSKEYIESRLLSFRLTDASRNYVELMFIFELIFADLLQNLSLGDIDINFIKDNVKYYLLECIKLIFNQTDDTLGGSAHSHGNNIVVMVLAFVFNCLMNMSNISNDLQLIQLVLPSFEFSLSLFINGLFYSSSLDINLNIHIDSSLFSMNLMTFLCISILLKRSNKLNKENLLRFLILYKNTRLLIPEILVDEIGLSEVEARSSNDPDIFMSHIDFYEIGKILLELIQLLFGSDGSSDID